MPTRALAPEEQELLRQVAGTVREVEPGAQVILYGSRARGNAAPDSDWDLLVLLDGEVNAQRDRSVAYRVYAVERRLEESPVLSTMVLSKTEWDSPLYRAMPFRANVEQDGIEL